jgi:hypothetical protein
MSVKDPDNIYCFQFDLPKAQVAHDLALLTLGKKITGEEDSEKIYDLYMELLAEFSTTVDGRTHYENPCRLWLEATPLGKSEFDPKESDL